MVTSCPITIHVPQEACIITTPLLSSEWQSLLTKHPQPELVFFISGISNGFCNGFKPSKSCLKQAQRNMESAYAHKEVVDNYLQAEVSMARVVGSFVYSVSMARLADSVWFLNITNQTRGSW